MARQSGRAEANFSGWLYLTRWHAKMPAVRHNSAAPDPGYFPGHSREGDGLQALTYVINYRCNQCAGPAHPVRRDGAHDRNPAGALTSAFGQAARRCLRPARRQRRCGRALQRRAAVGIAADRAENCVLGQLMAAADLIAAPTQASLPDIQDARLIVISRHCLSLKELKWMQKDVGREVPIYVDWQKAMNGGCTGHMTCGA